MPAPITEQTDPALALDAADFIHRAQQSARDTQTCIETNFGATLINLAQMHPEGVPAEQVQRSGELVLLEKGLIEEVIIQPYTPAAWILKAHAAGWRFDGRFRRLPQPIPFTLEEPPQ